MYPIQLALLGAEALLMSALVLGLFRVRTILGLSPLYIVIGGFQYLEASLSLRVEVAPGWAIYPGSSVMFTATLLAVLLVFIKEGTAEARKFVYGLVLANIGLTIVALLVSQHMRIPGSSVPAGVTASSLQFSARVAVVGATLLYLDVIGIILFYEYLGRFLRHLYPRALAALVLTVAFDNAWFTFLVQSGRIDYLHVMWAGLLGKAAAAVFYASTLYVYLRYLEPHEATLGTGDVSDVFQQLTYRERYEQARQRMTRDALRERMDRVLTDPGTLLAEMVGEFVQRPDAGQ